MPFFRRGWKRLRSTKDCNARRRRKKKEGWANYIVV
jgi:hypothetical protein